MATQLLNVLSYSDEAVVINLEYDDVTLVVAALESQNTTHDSCWVQVTNPQSGQQFTTTLAPGSNQRQPLPAGALTLQRVPGPPGTTGPILSFSPWTISSRFPA